MPPNPFTAMAQAIPHGAQPPLLEMFIDQLETLTAHLTSAKLAGAVYMALTQLEKRRPFDVTHMEVPKGADALDTAALAYAAARRTLEDAMDTVAMVGSLPGTPLSDVADSPEFDCAMRCLHIEIQMDREQSDPTSTRVTLEEETMEAYVELETSLQETTRRMREELESQTP